MAARFLTLTAALSVMQTAAATVIRKEATPFEEAIVQDIGEGLAFVHSHEAERPEPDGPGDAKVSLSQTDAEVQRATAQSQDKLAVAVGYKGGIAGSKEHSHSAHAAMSVTASGDILFESAQLHHKARTEQSSAHKVMERTLLADSSLKSDFSIDSSLATHHDRRRRCGEPSIKRNRHVTCFTPDCGPPPMAFMVALHNGSTQLESFTSAADVRWDTLLAGWHQDTTRTELDTHMTPERSVCSCDGCDEWNEWAIKELSTPYSCQYPGHDWHLVFEDLNPSSAYDSAVSVSLGRTFTTSNAFVHNVGMSKVMAKQSFVASAIYNQVAARLTANHDHAWEEARLTKETWNVQRGKPKVVWQYVLTCRVFNKAGLFINEAKFHTPIRVVTQTSQQPECDPNVDGCATASPHIVNC